MQEVFPIAILLYAIDISIINKHLRWYTRKIRARSIMAFCVESYLEIWNS